MQMRKGFEHVSEGSGNIFDVRPSKASENALLESRTNTMFIIGGSLVNQLLLKGHPP